MALVSYSKAFPDSCNQVVGIFSWSAMQNGDEGQPVELANFADRTIQVAGLFGAGGNVRVEGSIDGVNYVVLTDPQGNDLNINSGKIESVTELVRYIRPVISGGDGSTSLNVTLLARC
jgi:hypothetical protein